MENIEAAMKRIPPHSTEAEQAVLGAMLMNKEAERFSEHRDSRLN